MINKNFKLAESIYNCSPIYIEPKIKPEFKDLHDLLNYTYKSFQTKNYITIYQKSKNGYVFMFCDDKGNLNTGDIYQVVNKTFRTYEAAKKYFNKNFINIKLIESEI